MTLSAGWFEREPDPKERISNAVDALTARLLEANKRIATLEAALTPFAEAARLIPQHPDESSVEWTCYLTIQLVTQLRSAAAAMEGRK